VSTSCYTVHFAETITIKPIPEPPPVTRATLPLTSKTLLSWKLLFDILIEIVLSVVPRGKKGERRYLSSRYDDLFMEAASDVLVTILPQNWWGMLVISVWLTIHHKCTVDACLAEKFKSISDFDIGTYHALNCSRKMDIFSMRCLVRAAPASSL
jgi:hypothetical protein